MASKKILISAAEVSGDVHGCALARELKKLSPDIFLYGMGGEKMRAAGVDVRLDITEYSTIGLLEALTYLPRQFAAFRFMVTLLKKDRPDILVLIDAQGFNVPLAKAAKKLGIKTCYYIAPQEWLWGTPKNAKIIAETLDKIIAIFEEEYKIYKNFGANVVYNGHPLLDIVKTSSAKEETRNSIAICPGSRRQEFKHLLPILLEAAKMLHAKFPDLEFVIPLSSPRFRPLLKNILGRSLLPVKIIEGHTYDVLAHSRLALAASGTIVLESVILNTPVIMAYKLSMFTEFIGKKILGIKLPFYSMPNLLANENIVTELVQKNCSPEKIYAEAVELLKNPQKQTLRFPKILKTLGQSGAIQKAAEELLKM